MNTLLRSALGTLVLGALSAVAQAGAVFTFQEIAGNVVMTSSGSVDTDDLVLQQNESSWGGIGVEQNGNHDIMGGTSVGQVDISFGFHAGTNFSAWAAANGPFTQSRFDAAVTSGARGFTTYVRPAGIQLPGLGVERADIVGGIWTPDQVWSYTSETFLSLGLVTGTYTVTDAVTGEFLTIQIGDTRQVPLPLPLGLLAIGALALGAASRTRK